MRVVCVSWGNVFPKRVNVCMEEYICLHCVVLYHDVCVPRKLTQEAGPVDSLLNQPPLISTEDSSSLCWPRPNTTKNIHKSPAFAAFCCSGVRQLTLSGSPHHAGLAFWPAFRSANFLHFQSVSVGWFGERGGTWKPWHCRPTPLQHKTSLNCW